MGAIISILFIKQPTYRCGSQYAGIIPAPQCLHYTLKEDQVHTRDIIIVGDVHGCLDELKELCKITEEKYANNPMYIFVGDMINKGPKNVETLQFIRQMNCFAVRGNHEERVIKEWVDVESGRLSQFSKSYDWMNGLREDDMVYLMDLPYTISIPHLSTLIVHAGLAPWRPLDRQIPRHMITMRNITHLDTLLPQETEDPSCGVPWASLWARPPHVYFGHDARRRLQLYKYATGLDTGCLYGGSLSAINITRPNEPIISVPAKCAYKTPG